MSAPQPPASFPFDARPLTQPVSRATIKAHREELRRSGRLPPSNMAVAVLVTGGAVFALVLFGSVMIGLIGYAAAEALGTGAAPALVVVLPLATLAIGAIAVVSRFAAMRGRRARAYRLDTFARANGMQWFPLSANPPLPGMIFGIGSGRQALDVVRGHRPRFVEFGNHRYTTGSGKNQTTHSWGYVAVKLSSPLPHIVLDAKSNNSIFGSNLPATFHKEQALSLEGDFDRYFTLYCPREYERDALYLFTPDIMARFIDNAAALDVEIVDDWMFLYARRDFSTLDPNTWAWLFSVVGAFLDKFAQWERWRDERLAHLASHPHPTPATTDAAHASLPFATPAALLRPPPGVARQGQRLQRGIPWPAVIVTGAILVVWFLGNTGVLGSLLELFLP